MVDFDDVGRAVIAAGRVGSLRRVLLTGDRKYCHVRLEGDDHDTTFLAERVHPARDLIKDEKG